MPRPRFSKLSAEKREIILRAAAKEFGTHGYENASINRILEAAEVSKGAAYYYFDDKADLFVTVTDYFLVQLLGEVNFREIPLDTATFWPTIATMYIEQYERVEADMWMRSLMQAGQRLSIEARTNPLLASAFDRAWGWLKDLFSRGQVLGIVRTDLPDDLLFSAIIGMDDAFDRWIIQHWDELTKEQRRDLLERFVEGLRRFAAPL